MKNIIQFTCPKCGNHRLMLVESAAHRYSIHSLEAGRQGELNIGQKMLMDTLHGEPLGYRCLDCRYPDCNGKDSAEGFLWKSLEDIQCTGAISWPGGMETVEHRCMICHTDGKMTPVIVEVAHLGPLSAEERQLALAREQVDDGVLISQSDSGIRTLSCSNWKKVRHHILQPHSSV